MAAQLINILERHACYEGEVCFFSHSSKELGLEAKVGVFLPSQALGGQKVPALYVLAGLTCNQETFLIKSNVIRFAAQHNIALIAPDTSPRGAHIDGEDVTYDIGTGAGYYVDAVASPWAQHYRMSSYLKEELPLFMERHFPLDAERCGILGHSMGGMGALSAALTMPAKWKSASAFAPIASPIDIDWGKKVTASYFGGDRSLWEAYDPCLLMEAGCKHPHTLLVDQGMADNFLEKLQPDMLEEVALKSGQKLQLRRHNGFDHSYWFIQSFIEDHLAHHAAILCH